MTTFSVLNLPIDPQSPKDRIEYMLADSAAKVLLTNQDRDIDSSCSSWLPVSPAVLLNAPAGGPFNFHPSSFITHHSENLAYIIYTSGSAGEPKGVLIENRSVINFMKGITEIIPFDERESILLLTTISFDIFGLETLIPLCRGLKVVIGSREPQIDPLAAAGIIEREKITTFQVTPSRLQLFIADEGILRSLQVLKYLLVGGEVFPAPLLTKVRDVFEGKIFNLYGPTESTIWSTVKEVSRGKSLNIGKPITNWYRN